MLNEQCDKLKVEWNSDGSVALIHDESAVDGYDYFNGAFHAIDEGPDKDNSQSIEPEQIFLSLDFGEDITEEDAKELFYGWIKAMDEKENTIEINSENSWTILRSHAIFAGESQEIRNEAINTLQALIDNKDGFYKDWQIECARKIIELLEIEPVE